MLLDSCITYTLHYNKKKSGKIKKEKRQKFETKDL